jgi:hypothetical protein
MSAGEWGVYKQKETREATRSVMRGGFLATEIITEIAPAVEFDTLISLDIKEDARITNYPVEEGGFTSAAKGMSPMQITIIGAIAELGDPRSKKTADTTRISSAIETLESYKAGTELVDISTPNKVFLNMNLTSLSWKHTADGGVNMLEVTLAFQEVRIVKPQYTTIEVKNPAYETASEGGNTQAKKGELKKFFSFRSRK